MYVNDIPWCSIAYVIVTPFAGHNDIYNAASDGHVTQSQIRFLFQFPLQGCQMGVPVFSEMAILKIA